MVFFDFEFFFVISGLCLGFFVMIIRGMQEDEFCIIVNIIVDCLLFLEDEGVKVDCLCWVSEFCVGFFFYDYFCIFVVVIV